MPAETWSVPATVDNVTVLRQQAVRYARDHRVEEPPISDLALALGEAITNAVVHGFRQGAPGTMTVRLSIDPRANTVMATVSDDGMGFAPNPRSPGLGFGMPLIQQLADAVDVRAPASGRGTEICMTFSIPVGGG